VNRPISSRGIPGAKGSLLSVAVLAAAAVGAAVLSCEFGGPILAIGAGSYATELRAAALNTLDAHSYTVRLSLGLGFTADAGSDISLGDQTIVYQAPDRIDADVPLSILARAKLVQIGKDCWLSGVPEPDLTSGAMSCKTLYDSSYLERVLRLVAQAPRAIEQDGELVYAPADPATFLRESDFQLTRDPETSLSVRVEASLMSRFLGTLRILISQSPEPGKIATASSAAATLTFSSIDSSSVARPGGPPTETNGVLNTPTPPSGPETPSDRLLRSAAERTGSSSGFVVYGAFDVSLAGASLFRVAETGVFEAPDSVRETASSGARSESVTQIGNDCWDTDPAAGGSGCTAGGPRKSVLGPLRVLASANRVTAGARSAPSPSPSQSRF
jgi:hypothetical protein